ncbi:hypothetical protein BX600DRAFT_504332 [Xylariales sp. PMI_506]|nr:hypothetical protein BX600DRAFT_504332 [Xylariales sp. PMI_506]
MASTMKDLPVEIVEHIVSMLDVRDVASLRLVDRQLEMKASYGHFAALFKRKSVDLTTRSLQEMVYVMTHGRLGCLLEHCTITGVLQEDVSPSVDDTENLRLLTEAFANLKSLSPKGGLATLQLHIVVRVESLNEFHQEILEPPGFRLHKFVWNMARRTFHTTIAALRESQLAIYQHMDIFGRVKGCSLGCDVFQAFVSDSAFIQNFSSLQRLTMRLSSPVLEPVQDPTEDEDDEDEVPELERLFETQVNHVNCTLQNILQLRRIMPALAELGLHWYNLGRLSCKKALGMTTTSDISQEGDTGTTTAMNLKVLGLLGLCVSESSLLSFLGKARPSSLALSYTLMRSGTYDSIFNYITSQDSSITRFHLEDNRQRLGLVHFDAPGQPKYTYISGPVGPSTLTREGPSAKETIIFHFASGRPKGSPERARFLRHFTFEFGPEPPSTYNFVKLNVGPVAERRLPPVESLEAFFFHFE